jgi:RNA polymerase sigma-54 factor
MQLTQSASLRQELRQLLTPRMIQSMEILQLPLLALEERIEQELQANPVLELKEGGDPDEPEEPVEKEDEKLEERSMVVDEKTDQSEDFERLNRIAEYLENEEFATDASYRPRVASGDGEDRDRKLDAMANTAAPDETLAENLLNQWVLIECPQNIRDAGEILISFIDDDGYLKTPLDQIQKESRRPVKVEDLRQALPLVQTLEPAGVGATNLTECLLIQLGTLEFEGDDDERAGHDFDLEHLLVQNHLNDLKMNRYPQIVRKTGRTMEEVKHAVRMLSKLHPRPGRLVGRGDNQPITPDARIYLNEQTGKYEVEMARDPSANITLSQLYQKMLKEKSVDKKAREFLNNNLRNARWLLESIDQRRSTIERVIRAVVDAQQDFFEKGPEFLKPLPMIHVADQLGIHVATVSRAVSEKWIQTPRGIYPLRRFFSGGTTNSEGEDMSWDAVKEKLKIIIDNEDTGKPLSDDEIVDRLREQGINLARRTVAKYRKILNIPTARQRRKF